MAMISANPPVREMHRLIAAHGAATVARALVAALLVRHRRPRSAVPDQLRADVGLPPVAREMRHTWEKR